MGEKIDLAPFTYDIFEKQWLPQLGAGPSAKIPQNRFLLVRVSITNNGSTQAYAPNFVLEDDAGGTCAELNNGDNVPGWVGYLRALKPSDKMQGNVVFDCAPKHYRLKLSNDDNKYAYVDIPLAFDSDSNSGLDVPAQTGGAPADSTGKPKSK